MSKPLVEKDDTSQSIPGFLSKTFEIFSSPEYAHVCSWGPTGDTIIIKKIEEFSKQVLPLYFKHSNFQSFVRQLNMYDFHKTVQDPAHGEFQHPYFRQNRPDLLRLIKRKAHGKAPQDTRKRALSVSSQQQNDFTTESAAIMQELVQLRNKKDDIEKRLADMEAKQNQLIGENVMLKTMMTQHQAQQELMRQKMQKILYFMYDVYVNTAGRGHAGQRKIDGTRLGAIAGIDQQPDVMRILELEHPPAIDQHEEFSTPRITELRDTLDTNTNTLNHTHASSVKPEILEPFYRVPSIEFPLGSDDEGDRDSLRASLHTLIHTHAYQPMAKLPSIEFPAHATVPAEAAHVHTPAAPATFTHASSLGVLPQDAPAEEPHALRRMHSIAHPADRNPNANPNPVPYKKQRVLDVTAHDLPSDPLQTLPLPLAQQTLPPPLTPLTQKTPPLSTPMPEPTHVSGTKRPLDMATLLHDDIAHFSEQQQSIMTRLDSLDSTIAQMIEEGDFDFDMAPESESVPEHDSDIGEQAQTHMHAHSNTHTHTNTHTHLAAVREGLDHTAVSSTLTPSLPNPN